MSIEEAIRLIQTHERARQGRARASMYKNLMREMERQNAKRGESTMDKNLAAIAVQRRWRGYITRKKAIAMREEEFMFLGMEPTPLPKDLKQLPQYGAKKTEDRRRDIVKHNEKEYQQGLVSIKEKIRQAEGPDMKERMISQIRQWFLECRDVTGKFPDYPDEDEGGSAMIFKNKSVTELEREMADIVRISRFTFFSTFLIVYPCLILFYPLMLILGGTLMCRSYPIKFHPILDI